MIHSTTQNSIKDTGIMLVDHHPVIIEGLKAWLAGRPGTRVCASVGRADEALEVCGRQLPELAILELSLPDLHGLELIKDLRALSPQLKMLVFSASDEDVYGERCLRAGASGFMSKNESKDRLLQAVSDVLAGRRAVSDTLAQKLLSNMMNPEVNEPAGSLDVKRLSDRELEVFQLLGQGLATREIASRLNRGIKTIETYRLRIKEKLNLPTANELVARAAVWASNPGAEEAHQN